MRDELDKRFIYSLESKRFIKSVICLFHAFTLAVLRVTVPRL